MKRYDVLKISHDCCSLLLYFIDKIFEYHWNHSVFQLHPPFNSKKIEQCIQFFKMSFVKAILHFRTLGNDHDQNDKPGKYNPFVTSSYARRINKVRFLFWSMYYYFQFWRHDHDFKIISSSWNYILQLFFQNSSSKYLIFFSMNLLLFLKNYIFLRKHNMVITIFHYNLMIFGGQWPMHCTSQNEVQPPLLWFFQNTPNGLRRCWKEDSLALNCSDKHRLAYLLATGSMYLYL